MFGIWFHCVRIGLYYSRQNNVNMTSIEKGTERNSLRNFVAIQRSVENILGKITSFEKMPGSNNDVTHIKTKKGDFIVKIYDESRSKRTSQGREIQMVKLLQGLSETRKMVFSDTTREKIRHEFAVFDYVEGHTLRLLVENNAMNKVQLEDVTNQIFNLIKKISQIETQQFGRLDESGLRGSSETWIGFLENMQRTAIQTLKSAGLFSDSVYSVPQEILGKYGHGFALEDPRLIPMDLNMNNILITPDYKVKFIDLKTFWSGDPLFPLSHFYALTDGTKLGDAFLARLSADPTDSLKMRYYALLDLFHALAYITRIDSKAGKKARPWGNPNKFVDLIKKHVSYLKSH
jgi:aminoglycoside phosphotransferase (APT) family kinase protein